MKKGFTLAEALITLTLIGVVAAITIPVINNAKPDKDKITYKKALYNIQAAITSAMDSPDYIAVTNSSDYWADTAVGTDDFCEALATSLNTSGGYRCNTDTIKKFSSDCTSATASSYKCPNFITNDGIRYWGLEGKVFSSSDKYRTIYVDRDISDKEIQAVGRERGRSGDARYGLKIQVRYDGKVGTDLDNTGSALSDTFKYERKLVNESLKVQK